MTQRQHYSERGMIALIVVMVITAVIVFVGLSIALMSANEIQRGQVNLDGTKTGYLTGACVVNALARLRNNNSTSGNVNIAVGNVTCRAIISGSGNTRSINASATTTNVFGDEFVGRTLTNVNIATNPFTIVDYKDILE